MKSPIFLFRCTFITKKGLLFGKDLCVESFFYLFFSTVVFTRCKAMESVEVESHKVRHTDYVTERERETHPHTYNLFFSEIE